MLYNFKQLDSFLTQKGFPSAKERGIQIIKRDLTKEELAGNLEYKVDGIYLNLDTKLYKGYMYLKSSEVERYGLPKFHITNCSTIRQQRKQGTFEERYYWHNSKTATIEDTVTGDIHEDVELELCKNCAKQSNIREYSKTNGFYNLLDKQEIEDSSREIQLDIFGRPLDWEIISREYRREQNYTCEKCGFGGSMIESRYDRMYIHTDHIIAWEKANMRRDNLQCLCVLCHSQKDEIHRYNFSKLGMKKQLQAFVSKYRERLKMLGNEFIEEFQNQ